MGVYNPLARPVVWPVRLPVNGSAYAVVDAQGRAVDCEVCVWPVSLRVVPPYPQLLRLSSRCSQCPPPPRR